jgi:eukaryotic-like serine/threonine-protein kinase
MQPERWAQIDRLLDEALELEATARADFLATACRDDAELRREVEKLLASFEAADGFLETPAINNFGASFNQPGAAVGQRLAHYEILSLLGAGGMGEVYLARDSKLDRKLALKLLPARFSADPENVERFTREARTASALNHPNIITIYEIGQEDGTHFIATEFIQGETLRQRLARGKLAPREAVAIAQQIASALAAAHKAGVVHRDIKPENVMIWPDGLVKVLDFGLAKPLGLQIAEGSDKPQAATRNPQSLTDPQMLMGTLNYLSPEQARRQEVDHRTDIFSLGVVFYEMLTGTRPFTGKDLSETLAAIQHSEAAPLTDQPPAVAALLERIINRALAKEPAARYQRAEELCAELQSLAREFELAADARDADSKREGRSRWLLKAAAGLGLTVAAWGAWRLSNATSQPISSPWVRATATRVTGYPGEEFTPTLAPDGDNIVFVHKVNDDYNVCWQRLGEASFKNLTPTCPAADIQPALSPDGSQIAFRSDCDGGGIFLISTTGANRRRVSDIGYNPAWSPDGKEILYSTGDAFSPLIRRTAGGQLWAVRLDTGEKRHLPTPDAMQPSYSPRGLRIAYWGVNPANQQQRDIWTVPAQGGEPVAVTNDTALDWNPIWSPDGEYLYFVSNQTGIMNLWRVPLEEATGKVLGPPEIVTGPSSETWQPSFSRDGKRLIYQQRDIRNSLEALPFDPGKGVVTGKANVLTQGAQATGFPALSPDGEWLAYYNFGGTPEDIFIIKRDGSQLRQLTADECKDRMPRWSPDGKQIAFYSDCSGTDQIWTVKLETHARRQLTFQGGAGAQYPVWSPDGSRLAFHSRGAGTFILATGKSWQEQTLLALTPLKETGRSFIAWSWSADGRRLAGVMASADEDYPGIWVYEIESGQYHQLSKFGAYPIWLNDSRHLFFSDEHKLYLADTLAGTARVVVNVAPDEVKYGVPAHDTRRIYYNVRSAESDIWLLTLK